MADFEKITLLPMDEAIDYWRLRVPMSPDEYKALAAESKAKAFSSALATSAHMVAQVYQAIEDALADGDTFEEFQDKTKDLFEKAGYEVKPYQVETLFLTVVQSSYNAGRWKQLTDPDILEEFPYWEYDAVGDKRTRPAHMAMDGLVYPANHPFWASWFPPNGFRCRCSVRARSASSVKRNGLTIQKDAPKLLPDEGFNHSPAVVWKPSFDSLPKPLADRAERRLLEGPN